MTKVENRRATENHKTTWWWQNFWRIFFFLKKKKEETMTGRTRFVCISLASKSSIQYASKSCCWFFFFGGGVIRILNNDLVRCLMARQLFDRHYWKRPLWEEKKFVFHVNRMIRLGMNLESYLWCHRHISSAKWVLETEIHWDKEWATGKWFKDPTRESESGPRHVFRLIVVDMNMSEWSQDVLKRPLCDPISFRMKTFN